ncbi:hypothetical protein [Azospirillum brasilense]|uniref:hypothetical protein n=1 Tax=Azospirillum brasilense TaxID=192 RepID=UPI001EDAE5C4|nr:hypothetical protein [Azospirillum brasilense]UKJ74511.1 hypothetical protein H1Q64_18305 [Azospirillum brasilense]
MYIIRALGRMIGISWEICRAIISISWDLSLTVSSLLSMKFADDVIKILIRIYSAMAAICFAFAASAAPYLYVNDYAARCGSRQIMTLSWLNFISVGSMLSLLTFAYFIKHENYINVEEKRKLIKGLEIKLRSDDEREALITLSKISMNEGLLRDHERSVNKYKLLKGSVLAVAIFMSSKSFGLVNDLMISPPKMPSAERCESWVGEPPPDRPAPIIVILDRNLDPT